MGKKLKTLGILKNLAIVSFMGLTLPMAKGGSLNEDFRLKVDWVVAGTNQELITWTLNELQQFKKISSKEKDPLTGKLLRWDGILLSQLIEKGLEGLLPEKRAQVDLVVLKSGAGEKALLPRAFISKYPILLAFPGGVEEIERRGYLFSIVPWSSKPRVLEEELPLESYFVSAVERIQFTSYRDQYSSLFLKRRTDPSAMRGEKLFVQNCVTCHSQGQGPLIVGVTNEKSAELKRHFGRHPPVKVTLKLKERDWKSIGRYLDAHRLENPISVSKFIQPVQIPSSTGSTSSQ